MYPYWFIDHNKCTILMQDVNNRRNCVENIQEFFVLFAIFFNTSKTVLKQKSPKCSTWMQSQKRQNDLCSFPRQTIQYHGNPSLCPNQ